jgi:hypothetical protein
MIMTDDRCLTPPERLKHAEEKQQLSGFPSITGYDAWIENGRTKEACFELMISIDRPTRSTLENGFWLEFTAPAGEFIGWMRFTHLINLKNQAIFAAAEWRQANDQAPAQQDVLLPSLAPQRKGNG